MSTTFVIYLFAILFIPQCRSFDMGFHHDLTIIALTEYGFSNDATNVVVIHNWFTDFYSDHPLYKGLKNLAQLHFDNLMTSEEVRMYTDINLNMPRLLSIG
jgi:hypothetical protein